MDRIAEGERTLKAVISLVVDLDRAWLEHEGRRRGREKPIERLVSLLEGRAHDAIQHVDGVNRVGVTSSLDEAGQRS